MYWTRQYQLLFGSLLASLSRDLATMVDSVKISCDLWNKLSITYARPSRTRITRIREKLVKPQGSHSIKTYMFDIKGAVDELALLNEPFKYE